MSVTRIICSGCGYALAWCSCKDVNDKTQSAINEAREFETSIVTDNRFKDYCPDCCKFTYQSSIGCAVCGFIKKLNE